MGNFHYFGLFLEDKAKIKLLDVLLTFLHENNSSLVLFDDDIILDHCTLLHVSQLHGNSVFYDYLNTRIGKTFSIIINGIGMSDKAAAFRVDKRSVVSRNNVPHITIATFNGGKPVDSNNITEWKDIEPIIIKTTLKKV